MEYQSLFEYSLCTDSFYSKAVKIHKNNLISTVNSLIFFFLPFILSGVIRASLHLTHRLKEKDNCSVCVRERSVFLAEN